MMTAVLFLCLLSLVVSLLSANGIEWFAKAGDPSFTLTVDSPISGNESARYVSWFKENESGQPIHVASAVPAWQHYRVGSLAEGKFRHVQDKSPWKLEILNVSVEDAGTYTCHGSLNTPGHDRGFNLSGKLVVRDFVWSSSSPWYGLKGDSVILDFSFAVNTNETAENITWHRHTGDMTEEIAAYTPGSGFSVKAANFKHRLNITSVPGQLRLSSYQTGDEGNYSCSVSLASGEYGSTQFSISEYLTDFAWSSVVIKHNQSQLPNNSLLPVKELDTLELRCDLTNARPPGPDIFTWVLPGNERLTRYGNVLKIDSIQRKDAGEYACMLGRHGGSKVDDFSGGPRVRVQVMYLGSITAKVKDEVKGHLKTGDNVSLVCVVDRSPAVTVTWLHNETALGAAENDRAFSLALHFCGANVTYECRASIGDTGPSKSAFLQLNVECPPSLEVVSPNTAATGGNVTVRFRLQGNPPPQFDVPADASKSCIVSHTATDTDASVTFASDEDCFRPYVFRVTNKHGVANTTYNFAVSSAAAVAGPAESGVWAAVGGGLMVLAALLVVLCLAVLAAEMRRRARRELGDEESSSVENIPLHVLQPAPPREGASVTSPSPHRPLPSQGSGDSTGSGYERPQPFRVPRLYPNLPSSDGSGSSGYESPEQPCASPGTFAGGASAFPAREQSRLCRSSSEALRLQTLPDAIIRPLPPLPLPPKTRRPSLASSYMGMGRGHPHPGSAAYGAAAAAASFSAHPAYEDMQAAGRAAARLAGRPSFAGEINAVTDIPMTICNLFPAAAPCRPSQGEGCQEEAYDADAEHSSSSGGSLSTRDSDGSGSLTSEPSEDEQPDPPRESDPLLGAIPTAAAHDSLGSLAVSMKKADRVMYASTKALASLASRTASLERAKKQQQQPGGQASDDCDEGKERAEPFYANTARPRKPVWQLTPKLPPRCPLRPASPIREEPPGPVNATTYAGTGLDGPQDAPESAPAPVRGPDPVPAPSAVNGSNTNAGPTPAGDPASDAASESATAPTTPASTAGPGDSLSAFAPPANDPASGPTDASVSADPSAPVAAAPGLLTEGQGISVDEQRPSHQLQPRQEAEKEGKRWDKEDQSNEEQPLPPKCCRLASAQPAFTTGFDLSPEAADLAPTTGFDLSPEVADLAPTTGFDLPPEVADLAPTSGFDLPPEVADLAPTAGFDLPPEVADLAPTAGFDLTAEAAEPAPESTIGCGPTTTPQPAPAPAASIYATTIPTSATPPVTAVVATTPTATPSATTPTATTPTATATASTPSSTPTRTPTTTTSASVPLGPFITVPLVRLELSGSSPHTWAGQRGSWWKRSASEDSPRQPPVPPKTRRPRVLEVETALEVRAPPPCPLTPSVLVVRGPGDSSDDMED